MTTLYMAGPQSGRACEAARMWDWDEKPMCILVSFAYLDVYTPVAPYYAKARGFMLDSGAFTAYTLGKTIDVDALIAETNKPIWNEAVGLDVIGDYKGSVKNMAYMLPRCPKAMPVFHIGDPWDVLEYYAAHWDKVGLSCRFGEDVKTSLRFYDQCFARTWGTSIGPKRFHSFGWVDETALRNNPFHSADAATWVMQPAAYRTFPVRRKGKWTPMRLSTSDQKQISHGMMMNLDRYWRIEQQLKSFWSKEMAMLDALPSIAPEITEVAP